MRFKDLSLRVQLFSLVAVLMLALLGVSAVALVQLDRANQRLDNVYLEHMRPLDHLKAVSDRYGIDVVDSVMRLRDGTLDWEEATRRVREAELDVKVQWERYRESITQDAEAVVASETELQMEEVRQGLLKLKSVLASRDKQALDIFARYHLYPLVDPITQRIRELIALQVRQGQESYEAAARQYEHTVRFFIGLNAVALLVCVGAAVAVVRAVRRPLVQAQQAAVQFARGHLDHPLPEAGRNESGQLLEALHEMQRQLQDMEAQRWVKSQTSDITTALQLCESYTQLGQTLLSKLAPLVGVGHGVFYVMNTDQRLQLLATWGYKERKELSHTYELGQSLVGQCALEKKPITVNEPPPDYVRINSGTGDAVPRCIMLVPVMQLDEVLGVLELASFERFAPRQQALVDALMPMMAMNMEILQRKMRTQRLLEETQEQAERMEKQAAQLEEQAVEMEAQQAELVDTEAWFRSIVESAPDGLLVVDATGTIILCNAVIEQVFGYTRDELLGQKVEMLVPDSVRAAHPAHRADFMSAKGYRSIESGLVLRGRHKSGREFAGEFGLSMLPVRGSRGQCVAVSVRDISNRATEG